MSDVLVLGGTSDATRLCQMLDEARVAYTLSVATDVGVQLAGALTGRIRCGRLDAHELAEWIRAENVRWVIDATHPYAAVVSENARQACLATGVLLSRYQRPTHLDQVSHPRLHKVATIEQACAIACALGPRILLTTGSKDLAAWRAGLPEKILLARVLPVASVLAECEALGFGVETLFALKGPFSAEFNEAFYRFCAADVVITKESGAEGGYLDKVRPALDAGLDCIVLTRPVSPVQGEELLDGPAAFARRLAAWQMAAPVRG